VRRAAPFLLLALAAAGCGADGSPVVAAPTSTAPASSAAPTTAAPPPTTLPATTLPPTTTTTVAARSVTEQAWTPYATVGGVTLHHPSARVERVGFHESNHDGAQFQEPLPTAVVATTLESRERDTNAHGAADIVVDPGVEIRAPVTGTVVRGGTYVLYCEHRDDFVVIEPDDHPGWEVKVLHISGLQVRTGDRVVAGETVLAPGPTQLPFESQVDELRTADPAWPHVHVEVVDPTVRDRPSPGGGCS
jgi:murein DD-endopeptidase MepM/ murein hydrolase activator NlpD